MRGDVSNSQGYSFFKRELSELENNDDISVNEKECYTHPIINGEFYHPLFGSSLNYKSLILIGLNPPSMEGELFRDNYYILVAKKQQLRRIVSGLENNDLHLSGGSSIHEGVLLYDFKLPQEKEYERICLAHEFIHNGDRLIKVGNLEVTILPLNLPHSQQHTLTHLPSCPQSPHDTVR